MTWWGVVAMWAAVIIAGSVGCGVIAEWLITAYRHRNEHYESDDPYSRG